MPETIYNGGYFISSGRKNYLSIKRIKDVKLEQPYNNRINWIMKYLKNVIKSIQLSTRSLNVSTSFLLVLIRKSLTNANQTIVL
jgi:hypothetical protein